VNRRLAYLEGFRDALEAMISHLRRVRGCLDARELAEALDRALIQVEEEMRLLKARMHPVSTLLEELNSVARRCAKAR